MKIYEIFGGVVAAAVVTVVGNLWYQVDVNKTTGLKNKDAISLSDKVGESEIRRSTAVDNNQADDILDNNGGITKNSDLITDLRVTVGKLETAIEFLHRGSK